MYLKENIYERGELLFSRYLSMVENLLDHSAEQMSQFGSMYLKENENTNLFVISIAV